MPSEVRSILKEKCGEYLGSEGWDRWINPFWDLTWREFGYPEPKFSESGSPVYYSDLNFEIVADRHGVSVITDDGEEYLLEKEHVKREDAIQTVMELSKYGSDLLSKLRDLGFTL